MAGRIRGVVGLAGCDNPRVPSQGLHRFLATELISTRRRVNVLEHVVIPELGEQIKYIYRKLSEAERDNISRLMKIADIIRR